MFRIFGYEPGSIAVTNENFFAAVHPEDRERIAVAVKAAIDAGTRYSIDHRVIRPDGSVRIVHEESEVQYDAAGKPRLLIGTVQDVTDQRMHDAQLALTDRMTSIGTLAAGVAHEINNPLAAVVANLDLLAIELANHRDLPNSVAAYLRGARQGADRITAIVRDFMVYAHGDDSRPGPVDVLKLLDSALLLVAHELEHRAQVVRDYGEVPPVIASGSRLSQVFLNLLRNAAQAISESKDGSHEVRVGCKLQGGQVLVTIADTGIGIPTEIRSRVFAPFFTTKPAGVGSGLGLAISHRIVSDLGGTIDFETAAGEGTTFRVALPVETAQHEPLRLPRRSVRHATVRRRILVVDDERMILDALERLLCEHEVTMFDTALAALRAIGGGARFDLILCDLMMPAMTGIEFYDELAKLAPEQAARVVLMTGSAGTSVARDFLTKMRLPLLAKPFDLELVHGLIESITRA